MDIDRLKLINDKFGHRVGDALLEGIAETLRSIQDTLKIDQSFIRGGMHDSKDLALVKSIIDIGINLNLNVVAEGIETDKHVNLLRKFGCPSGQGYLFNPPLTADEIEETYLIPSVQ